MHAKFYALLAQMPGATKEDIVSQYEPSGSLSALLKRSRRLYTQMLNDMAVAIRGCSESEAIEGDKWRKMVIAAIRGYFNKQGLYKDKTQAEYMTLVKQTATRSAQVERFNDIPIDKLRRVYNTFNRKQKD